MRINHSDGAARRRVGRSAIITHYIIFVARDQFIQVMLNNARDGSLLRNHRTAAIGSRHQIMSCVDHLSTPVYKCFPPSVRTDATPRQPFVQLMFTFPAIIFRFAPRRCRLQQMTPGAMVTTRQTSTMQKQQLDYRRREHSTLFAKTMYCVQVIVRNLQVVQPYFLHHVQHSSTRDIRYKIITVYHSPKSIVSALFPLNSQSINFIIIVTIL